MPSPSPATTDWVPIWNLSDTPPQVIPIGASMEWDYGSAQLPSWALLQYGQAVSRTTYSRLHILAAGSGYPHGAGDGSTTFNLADKRGRVSVGKDNMGGTYANRLTAVIAGASGAVLGAACGSEGVTLATSQIPSHSHGGATGGESADHTHSGQGNGRSADHTHGDPGHYHRPAVTGVGWDDGSLGDGNTALSAGGGAYFGTDGNSFWTHWGYMNAGGRSAAHVHGVNLPGISANHNHGIGAEGGGGAHLNVQPTIIVNKVVRAL